MAATTMPAALMTMSWSGLRWSVQAGASAVPLSSAILATSANRIVAEWAPMGVPHRLAGQGPPGSQQPGTSFCVPRTSCAARLETPKCSSTSKSSVRSRSTSRCAAATFPSYAGRQQGRHRYAVGQQQMLMGMARHGTRHATGSEAGAVGVKLASLRPACFAWANRQASRPRSERVMSFRRTIIPGREEWAPWPWPRLIGILVDAVDCSRVVKAAVAVSGIRRGRALREGTAEISGVDKEGCGSPCFSKRALPLEKHHRAWCPCDSDRAAPSFHHLPPHSGLKERCLSLHTLFNRQLAGGRTTTVRSRARLQKRQPEARAQLVCCDRARLLWRVAAVSGRDRFQILSLSAWESGRSAAWRRSASGRRWRGRHRRRSGRGTPPEGFSSGRDP
eukprot:scaffold56164_cov61-Phaeocystis_antarctica.AAC.5